MKESKMFTHLKLLSYLFSFCILFTTTMEFVLSKGKSFNTSNLYLALFFPMCLTFQNFEIKHRIFLILLISFFTAIGVFHTFLVSMNGGYDALISFQQRLRPDAVTYSQLSGIFRLGGYVGSNHDAANLLTICSVYLLLNIISMQGIYKFYSFLVFILSGIAIFLTISASNITIFIFSSLVLIYFTYSRIYYKLIFSVILILMIYTVIIYDLDFMYTFIKKFNSSSNSENSMLIGLDFNSLKDSIFSFIFGFGPLLDMPSISTELALIKLFLGFGFIPFIILCYLLLFPFLSCLLNHRKLSFFSYSLPTLTGCLTLLHYGSAFRSSSVLVFALLYSLFLTYYYNFNIKKLEF